MLHGLLRDVRYATRSLIRNRTFSLAAVLTIALGIGINIAVFSGLNGALFRGLPAPDADELVSIYQSLDGVPERSGAVSFGLFSTSEYRTYRDRARTLSGVFGHSDPWGTTLGGENPLELRGSLVTCNYFDVLGQPPATGRSLTEQDCEAGSDPVVVLGHETWMTAFGGDAGIVGRTVELNRQSFSVVGIAREGTYGGSVENAAFYAPISAQLLIGEEDDNRFTDDDVSWLFLIGRRNFVLVIAYATILLALRSAARLDPMTTLRYET